MAQREQGHFFYIKEDEYSPSGVRFPWGQVESFLRFGLAPSSRWAAGLLTVFGSPCNCQDVGWHNFYYVNEERGHEFTMFNECTMYLEVKPGSASPPCWTQPVSASLLSILSLPILREQLAQNV